MGNPHANTDEAEFPDANLKSTVWNKKKWHVPTLTGNPLGFHLGHRDLEGGGGGGTDRIKIKF